ncbi:MAG: M23 family metallopeptidase [Bacteroidetes bacterium]|nr:MAG: M23 family metallopeptidase [Bacteroidota bacterium]
MPEKKSNDRLRRSSDIENDVRQRDIVQEEYSTLNQARGTQGDISRQENVDTLRWRTQSGNYLPLTMPVLGYQTKQYTGEQHHEGIDIVAKEGSPVVAAANGTIIYSDWTLDDGMMIIIAHGAGLTTVYKHNKALLKRRGAIVKRGETVALLGNTGRTSTGPHLHFEVWNNGIALNPMNYLITIQ